MLVVLPYLVLVFVMGGGVNSSPVKEGVSVSRMNEQSDKLCKGPQRGAMSGQTLLSLTC